ncbi:hypothetical protein PO428_21800 [Escherichia coli]
MKKLDTSTKRVGFLILALGIGLFLFGWILWAWQDTVYAWDEFAASVIFDTYYWNTYNLLISIGFYLSLIGFALSYFYDAGIGKIVRWIKLN